MSFSDLGLNESLLSAVSSQGYTQPTPIQAQAIPAVIEGRDLLAAAQTGTGKTAAFTLPILERLSRNKQRNGGNPRVLVLTPTRELAAQVADSVKTYGGERPVRSTVIFGGVSAVPQVKALRRGVAVVIATPGRLLDHLQQGNVDLADIETFILDEADRMLDMGFIRDIRKIMDYLPKKRQNLLFSATFSKDIRQLAKGFLHKPVEINVSPPNATADLIEQKVIYVAKHQKRELLSWMIGKNNWKQVLVFTRTKHGANRLSEQLGKDGLTAAAIHGNKSQGARTKALDGFKTGKVRVLVATDIAARGIDIDQLPHVINYELPNVPADYVHRIGRTGRAGVEGEALSLVCAEERGFLRDINKLIGRQVPELKIEDFHLQEEKVAPVKPKQKPNNRKRGGGGGQGARSNSSRPANRSGKPGGNRGGGGNRSSQSAGNRNQRSNRRRTAA